MQLHTDQVAIQPPIRDISFGMNILFYLEDVTEKNGATRVYPGSHLGPAWRWKQPQSMGLDKTDLFLSKGEGRL